MGLEHSLARAKRYSPEENPYIWNIVSDGTESNLLIVAATILSPRGVSVVPFSVNCPKKDVKICAPKKIWPVLDGLKKRPEFEVLQQALYGFDLRSVLILPNLWDENMRKRVFALFWESYALNCVEKKSIYLKCGQEALNSHNKNYLDYFVKAEEYETFKLGALERARVVLDDLDPLSKEDIRLLVSDLIQNVEDKLSPR